MQMMNKERKDRKNYETLKQIPVKTREDILDCTDISLLYTEGSNSGQCTLLAKKTNWILHVCKVKY